ncbi:iron ABC transporter permease [Pseudooceanicola sp. CBS1P-1]|uniref:Iron chelate uptake ABC transporter family permease subunit n=1 Tax=Pseudooceanicola albus TaxID=2692189 RepID=A0A6L7GB61_9RHOB|nr:MULTISPECIES: iron ABC transporter permease [Pseudooceanicola]MBT9386563.1 iron ABC transporter permease [Pseudooceanicola endophyticus]MXN20596.1 iron chelate uptake ABC transporter family permease subunit [Pseudooceanicola albus]
MRLLLLGAGLVAIMLLAMLAGARGIAPADLAALLGHYDPTDPAQITLLEIRLPRLVAGLIAGAALGVAGMVMQAVTRNPLADPGLLGVNAGAAFSLLLGATLLGRGDAASLSLLTLPGAGLAALAVFSLGGGLAGDAGPVRLTLAGVALNAFLLSLVSLLVLLRRESLDVFRFWVAGSLAEAGQRPLTGLALLALCGIVLALLLAPRLEALSLGGALARGLGTHPGRVLAGALLAVTLCTGAAVAVAGPIAFLGLVVPPLARRIMGTEMRGGLIAAALLGAGLLLLADIAGRLLIPPGEIRAGVMTALLGGPVFLWIARRLRPGEGA